MSIRIISTDEELYEKALNLRYELFFKAYDLPESTVKDEIESKSVHVAITDNYSLIAYARLTDLGGGFKVEGNPYASKTTNIPHVKMVLSPIT